MIEFLLGVGVLVGALLVCFAVGVLMTLGEDATFGNTMIVGVLFTIMFGLTAVAVVVLSMAIGGAIRGTL